MPGVRLQRGSPQRPTDTAQTLPGCWGVDLSILRPRLQPGLSPGTWPWSHSQLTREPSETTGPLDTAVVLVAARL